ncbi:protopine 6-monooxygenase-like [Papaver somniferum]|nr:protopine 6-monooxygenase-like [Papaver somniferum]
MDFSSLLLLLLNNWISAYSMAALLALVLVYNLRITKSSSSKTTSLKGKKIIARPPAVTGAWPVLGHLHLFGSGEHPHEMLSKFAEKYGPAFTMKFGKHTTLVVSDTRVVKECFTTNDTLFSNRPSTIAFDLMTYATDSIAFTPYSPYWRELRKISTLKLLSNNRLESIKQLRTSEVSVCFKELYELTNKKSDNGEPVPIDLKRWFDEVSNNVTMRVIFGKQNFGSKIVRGEDQEAVHYKKIMDELSRLSSLTMLSDMVPLLGWLDYFKGDLKAMKRNGKELNSILQKWLEEHKSKKSSHDRQDFMDVMLSISKETQLYGHDQDTFIKATCLAMIMGGTNSTEVALTWILSLLMNNRYALHKARQEIDLLVGKDRQVEDSDVKNLTYMNAIIKETMRLYPLGFLLERDAKEDCEVGGFNIEGGTRLLINVWKLQRDPNVWTDPMEFKPERFLTENADIDVGGQHFELLPFGAGRRVCPGVSFALQFMHLVLARLIHGYDMETINGEDVDLSVSSEGHVNIKSTPLELILTPRLHPKLYDC